MNAFTCPKCGRVISSEDINVATDVAFCRACHLASKFSALVQSTELTEEVDFDRPPAGVQYRPEADGMLVSATHRSLGEAVGMLAVSLFWNGIVSVFVVFALASTLQHLGIPLPVWFPVPNVNDALMSVGMNIFLWMFLTPFIAIGAVLIGNLMMCLGGRTEVQIRDGAGSLFTGIGSLGYRRRFDPSAVKSVRIESQSGRFQDGPPQQAIILETQEGKLLKCGTMLREERRKFVAAAVLKALPKKR